MSKELELLGDLDKQPTARTLNTKPSPNNLPVSLSSRSDVLDSEISFANANYEFKGDSRSPTRCTRSLEDEKMKRSGLLVDGVKGLELVNTQADESESSSGMETKTQQIGIGHVITDFLGEQFPFSKKHSASRPNQANIRNTNARGLEKLVPGNQLELLEGVNNEEKSKPQSSPFDFFRSVSHIGWSFGKKNESSVSEEASIPDTGNTKPEMIEAENSSFNRNLPILQLASVVSSASSLSCQIDAVVNAKEQLKFDETKSDGSAKELSPLGKAEQIGGMSSPPKPKTEYNDFLEKLKDPRCGPAVSKIKRFVELFPIDYDRQKAANRLHKFLTSTLESLLKIPVFSDVTASESPFILDKLEKFVVQKLFDKLFYCSPYYEKEDIELSNKLKCLEWVTLEHLEITVQCCEEDLILLQQELWRLDKMKSPRDKLILILNSCRGIVSLLESEVQSLSTSHATADDILPLLIYTIIKSQPIQLYSTITFILSFRHPSRHVEEEAYFFVQFCSAVIFICNLGDTTSFNILDAEYCRLFEASRVSHNIERNDLPSGKYVLSSNGFEKLETTSTYNEGQSPPTSAVDPAPRTEMPPPPVDPTLEESGNAAPTESSATLAPHCNGAAEGAVTDDALPDMVELLDSISIEKKTSPKSTLLEELIEVASNVNARYENISSVDELQIGDLSNFFEEYHQLLALRRLVLSAQYSERNDM